MRMLDDYLGEAAVAMPARHLVCLVCVHGGLDCPLIGKDRAAEVLARLKADPTATIRLDSDAECIPHYATLADGDFAAIDPTDVFNRKRDLDVLQRLGLVPGSIRRARYLVELLFERIETPDGICAYDTPGWEGCPMARSGAYESVRAKGWQELVYRRSEAGIAATRSGSARPATSLCARTT